jgi:RHS repeat-associated protein
LDQLIKVTNPDNSVEKYFYDTLGNRVQKEITIPGKNENKESTTNVTKYTYNKDNQMLTLQGIEEEVALHQTSDLVNFEYDGRGNTVKISTQEGIIGQYRYDATNKMTHAINKKGIRSEYIYDGAGRRVTQKVEEPNINVPEKSSLHDAAYFEEKFGTSSTEDIDYKKEMNYIVDITSIFNNVLKVYGENTKTQRYTYGLDVISMDTWHEKEQDNGNEKNNDKTLYYINNELGSVVKLVDGKDKVKVEYRYDTFGVVAEKNHVNDQSIRSNIFHYTGYQYDYQTGLYFANARYYIAEVGRFAEEDVYKGDGLNRYVYVRSNPLRYVDRSGYSSSEGMGNPVWDNANIGGRKIYVMSDRDHIYIQAKSGDSLNDIMYLLTGIKNYYTNDTAYKPNRKSKIGITMNIDNYVTDAQLSMALGTVITKYGSNGYSRSQSVALGRLNNIITNHMKLGDFSGTELDLQGNPIPKPGGGTWDHMNEMNNSYEGLKSVRETLNGSLKNPNLKPEVRQNIQEALNKTDSYMSQIEKLYDKYDKTPGNDSNNGSSGNDGTGGGGSGGTNPPIMPIIPIMPINPMIPNIPIFGPMPMPVFL